MTIEQKNKIIELYNLGVTKTKIAQTLNVSYSSVKRCLTNITKIDPMIGQRFARLKVIEQDNQPHKKAGKYYICICECGNRVSILGSSLRSGHTKSCGCLQKECVTQIGHNNAKDLTGEKFGQLTVLYSVGFTDSNKQIWHCKCNCGREIDVRACNLKSGNTQSCGCLQSVNEKHIIEYLTEKNIAYKTQYTFSDLYGQQKPLRFDFALIKQNQPVCLIEYQGSQHWDINNPWHTELLEQYDNKKQQYCKDNNIKLFLIDKYDNLEERLDEIIQYYDRL